MKNTKLFNVLKLLFVLVFGIIVYLWSDHNASNIDFKEEYRTYTLKYSKHAKCRMECRFIDENEVKDIIKNGSLNTSKIQQDDKGKTFPLEGITRDGQKVRIVIAPKDGVNTIVTVIDLENEYKCDC